MLQKLKELLGEELSKQVQEKLGDIELAVFNDGSVVPATKYETLKADHQGLTEKYQNDISGLNSKLTEAMASAADYDSLKNTIQSVKAENEQIAKAHQEELLKIKMDSAIDVALLKANVKESYLPLLKTQLNTEALTFDGDNLIGLTDTIQTAQNKFPDLFGTVKKVGVNPDNGINPATGKKQQLIEQYNQAEKAKDVKQMALLDKQIRSIKGE